MKYIPRGSHIFLTHTDDASFFEWDKDSEDYVKLDALCKQGIEFVRRQLDDADNMDVVALFRKGVVKGVISGEYMIQRRLEQAKEPYCNIIFTDDEFYYFQHELFDSICSRCGIGCTSKLVLKRSLREMEVLKSYTHTKSKAEFAVDFLFKTEGGSNSCSGFGLRREFWGAEIGGMYLEELQSE